MSWRKIFILFACCSMAPLLLHAQDKAGSECPIMATHRKGVTRRGDNVMGFAHDKTTHHFRLYADGGAIEVTVNDSKDSENMHAIQSHLTHIVTMFAAGDFSMPIFVHDQVPPGVLVMKDKRAEIFYRFEELPTGGRVRIKTANADARKAIHDFLRFQIEDHHTGDTTDISAF